VNPERLPELRALTQSLRSELVALRFEVVAPGGAGELDAGSAANEASAMVRQLDDHVLPRLNHLDAPALVIVGGSTGSGKSLLVNSLAGADVTRPGVLRPTTTAPALIHDPTSADWFGSTQVLPGLARVHGGEAKGHHELRLVSAESIPAGVAILDSPDIDSVSVENRALAAELLAAGDLWIFTTTAARYADAVPWEFLTKAREQDTPLVMVMNRVPAGHEETLRTHLEQMLSERGLGGTHVFTIAEQSLDGTRLPVAAVADVRKWLVDLANDDTARAAAIARSLTGSLVNLEAQTRRISIAAARQSETIETLRTLAHAPYKSAAEQIRIDIGTGAVLKGEVLSRWEELLGTGELLRQLRTGVARLRDRIAGVVTGRPKQEIELNGAVEHVVETLIRTRADEAAAKAAAAWRSHPAGAELLRSADLASQLDSSTSDLGSRAAFVVREWQGHVLDLIRGVGGDRKTKARVLSFGLNGVAMVVMVLVFAHTGGLSGAEVAVASGASALGHTLLEAVLGDQTIRSLAMKARSDLEERIDALLAVEVDRFDATLKSVDVDGEASSRLNGIADELKRALR
jgi:energy-coupling factor transporter ATP-binding protein EcfA2